MTSFLRRLRPLVLLATLGFLPLSQSPLVAQPDAAFADLAATLPAPTGVNQDDPWLYRGTDIPVDEAWLFGELDNGLRYAVRRNGVPPDQVSIRIRIDAGSLHEEDDQRGFAHLLEHLTFRESKYLEAGTAIHTWQRLGATFGSDTNALTTPTQTVYRLDLPNAHPAALSESFRLLSGMIREPTLSEDNLKADVPIVLAELREAGGPQRRIFETSQSVFYEGQLLAERAVSGDEASLRAATPQRVRAFHDRWYRPENTVVVASGDADPKVLAALIEANFADWKRPDAAPAQPDFGRPKAPVGANPENPVGLVKVLAEPDIPRSLTYVILRPWEQVNDNIEYNRGLMLDAISMAVLNRRLENRARSGGSFLFASAEQNDVSRSADLTFVNLTPVGPDWQSALREVRAVIADALTNPPSQDEIDAEVAQYEVYFANALEQEPVQAGSKLADDIVQAVDIREAVASPRTVVELFSGMKDRFTPENVLQHTRKQFQGDVIRGVLVVADEAEATEADFRQALLEPVSADNMRQAAKAISFDELPPIGTPAEPVSGRLIGLLDMKQFEFANGVRALTWKTTNEPGRATVRVRFGAGFQAFEAEDAPYIELGQYALIGSGIGDLGQNEIDRIASGRKLGLDFSIDEGTFVLQGETRPADIEGQLYLMAAKLGMPRWDAAPVERARALAKLAYDAYSSDPAGVVNRDLNYYLHNRDRRYAAPTPQELDAATPEGFRKVWEPILKQGPVEVMVFGDFDEPQVIDILSRTFGALPPREPLSDEVLAKSPAFPMAQDMPTVAYHRGDANQGAAVIAWPTGGGSTDIPEARKLEVLAQIFSNRLLDAMREKTGASYAPQVFSDWPLDVEKGGEVLAMAQIPPEQIPVFFATADGIAADLAANPPDADELNRVVEPLYQQISRYMTGHQYWMSELQGATFDPIRADHVRTLMRDYTGVDPAEMQSLAQRYLVAGKSWRLAVIPEGETLARSPIVESVQSGVKALEMAE